MCGFAGGCDCWDGWVWGWGGRLGVGVWLGWLWGGVLIGRVGVVGWFYGWGAAVAGGAFIVGWVGGWEGHLVCGFGDYCGYSFVGLCVYLVVSVAGWV